MRTAGEILRSARQKRGWSLEELSRRTKIQEKFLKAIELSQFSKLPKSPFVKGLIRTAAGELGLDPAGTTAIFRRDFGVSDKTNIVPKTLETGKKSFGWTPRMTAAAGIAIVVISFLGYLGWQLLTLASGPTLIITQPAAEAVAGVEVAVEGKSDPGATVTINGQEIKKNKDGGFSQILSLTPGEHTITVMAVGQNGKKATAQRTVRVK